MLFQRKRDTNDLGGINHRTTKRKLSPMITSLLATVLLATSMRGVSVSVIFLSMDDGNHHHNHKTKTDTVIRGGLVGVDALPVVSRTRTPAFVNPAGNEIFNANAKTKRSIIGIGNSISISIGNSNSKHLTAMRTSSSDQSLEAASTTTTTTTFSTTTPTIEWIPTRIEFDGFYRSYGQPSLWRKLTSSVPRREFALQDLTLAFGKTDPTKNGNNESNNIESESDGIVCNTEDALCLLLGASSSGKSTIFRSILKAAAEGKYTSSSSNSNSKEFGCAGNQGTLEIRRLPLPEQTLKRTSTGTITDAAAATTTAKPILLDDRGEVNEAYSGQRKKTLGEVWTECFLETTETANGGSNVETDDVVVCLVETLAKTIFDLDPNALLVDLTPSEKYRFCLAKACIQSSVCCASSSNSSDNNSDNSYRYLLPGPILLLDEWMDVETSAVVRKVQPSLHKIVEELNGVVLSITHKPELYYSSGAAAAAAAAAAPSPGEHHSTSTIRKITLSAGKLLSDY